MFPRTALSTAALVLIAAALLAAPATAGMTYETTISMSEKFPAFHGKLHSPYTYCTQNRKVKLYRKAKRSGPDKLLGSDTSESDGTWSIPIGNRLIGGFYYSTVGRKYSAEVGVTCKSAKSRVAVVD
jgi:hypothetical protein